MHRLFDRIGRHRDLSPCYAALEHSLRHNRCMVSIRQLLLVPRLTLQESNIAKDCVSATLSRSLWTHSTIHQAPIHRRYMRRALPCCTIHSGHITTQDVRRKEWALQADKRTEDMYEDYWDIDPVLFDQYEREEKYCRQDKTGDLGLAMPFQQISCHRWLMSLQ